MRRALRLLLFLAAGATASCGFDAAGTGDLTTLGGPADSGVIEASVDDATFDASLPDVAPDDAAPDAPPEDTAAPDAPDAAEPFCDPSDPNLVACYAFEGDGTDGSANGNDLSATGVTFVSGKSGQALSLSPTASVKAPEGPSWAVTNAITIELWVRPRTLPSGGRMGLVDDDGRFGLFVYPPGVVRAMSPSATDTPAPLTLGAWTHVAFTYDGATIRLYVNGLQVVAKPYAGSFGGASGAGVAVGMNSPSGDVFDGEIDSLRVFRVARTPTRICQAAGTC